MRDDFPTLDRPTKAYSGRLGVGNWSSFSLLLKNLVEMIFMRHRIFPTASGSFAPGESVLKHKLRQNRYLCSLS